jgi:predicted AAA+ superfamily ATPase
MKRELSEEITAMIQKKMILISGPRQAGKTTLAKSINQDIEYLNYDRKEDRNKILAENWDRSKKLIIFDEIHKMKNWKLWLKGVVDTEQNNKFIVTGSARIETLKKVGDSMAGRYFHYQLFPFDLKELHMLGYENPTVNLTNLLKLSGFPEPFLGRSESYYKKWRRTHLDVILKQDVLLLDGLKRIEDVSNLVEFMTERVGSITSYNSLCEDLQTDDKTVKRWFLALENSYVFFKITPFSTSLKNTIKKAPKHYFFDYPRVLDEAARLENLVAFSLLKEVQFRNETLGEDYSLHFLKDNKQLEIDFVICKNKKPIVLIEVKTSDSSPSKNFQHFIKMNPALFKDTKKIQLVKNLKKNFSTSNHIQVVNLAQWLSEMMF